MPFGDDQAEVAVMQMQTAAVMNTRTRMKVLLCGFVAGTQCQREPLHRITAIAVIGVTNFLCSPLVWMPAFGRCPTKAVPARFESVGFPIVYG